jgi:hypothetical protein
LAAADLLRCGNTARNGSLEPVCTPVVEQADGGGVLGQEPAPGLKRPVAGDAQGAAFVGGRDDAEQQLGAGVIERGEADFVDLCGCPHRWTYADTETMRSPST